MAAPSEDGSGIDANILSAEIPLLRRLTNVTSTGESAWAFAYRIDIAGDSGEDEESYFMKLSVGEHGKRALKGEYESTLAIYNATPDFAPKPLDWGSLEGLDNTHYYLCKYHELSQEVPHEAEFTEKLARLHRKGRSPNGKFGFHVVTYNGDLPQDNTWADTWLDFFINGFEHILRVNVERGGPWKEMEHLKPNMISKVIPRLIKPMETGQRSVEPVLVHGDLWCGNAAMDVELNQPLVYDPSSFYAHNEYELGNWRPERNQFSSEYFKEYHAKIQKSFPEDDYDDRNALYAIRFNLHAAAIFPENKIFRQYAEDEMKRLIAKFPGGFEDYAVPEDGTDTAPEDERETAPENESIINKILIEILMHIYLNSNRFPEPDDIMKEQIEIFDTNGQKLKKSLAAIRERGVHIGAKAEKEPVQFSSNILGLYN